jgi:hypothetical protein
MNKPFMMKLNGIQLSQLYINSEKLSEVMKTLDSAKPESIEPIPIKELEIILSLLTDTLEPLLLLYIAFPKFQYIGKTRNLIGMLMKSVWDGARKREFAP